MILQLNPPIPVVTPLGPAEAMVLVDYGNEFDLQWVCFLKESRIVVTFRQPYIRMQDNLTMGREDRSFESAFGVQERAGRLAGFFKLLRWLNKK